MDKRYQIFISSTFRDLIEERQAVLKAILELNHMPAGMELFPASDDGAWQLIKDVIDASDYYVLIIGGRYGALDETGIGYTEREYDYAISSKKPIIALLHENPDNLPREKTETDELSWEKLKNFRKKVESKHTRVTWKSAEELKSKVIIALVEAFKRKPRIGWVRADRVPSEDTLSEILALRKTISRLESELEFQRTNPPKGTENLSQGNDEVNINCTIKADFPVGRTSYPTETKTFSGNLSLTWNHIWAGIGPVLIQNVDSYSLRQNIKHVFEISAKSFFKNDELLKKAIKIEFDFSDQDIQTCIIQFRALGLIKEFVESQGTKGKRTYWALTPYGDQLMVELRAIRREKDVEFFVTPPPIIETEEAKSV